MVIMENIWGMEKFIDCTLADEFHHEDPKTGKRIIHRTPTWVLECVCKDTNGFFQWNRDFFRYLMNHWFEFGVSDTRIPNRYHPEDHSIKFGVHISCKNYRENEAKQGPNHSEIYVHATPEELEQRAEVVKRWLSGDMLANSAQGLLPWDPESAKIRAIVFQNQQNYKLLASAKSGLGDSLVKYDYENMRAYWSKQQICVTFQYGKPSKSHKKNAYDARTLQTNGYLDARYRPTIKLFELPQFLDPTTLQTNRWFLVPSPVVRMRLGRGGFNKATFFQNDTTLCAMKDLHKKEFRQIDYVYHNNLSPKDQATVHTFAMKGEPGCIGQRYRFNKCEIAQKKYLHSWIMSEPSSMSLSASGTFLPAKSLWSRLLANIDKLPSYNVFVVILFEDPPARLPSATTGW